MKLRQLFEEVHHKAKILSESVRYGAREQKEALDNSDNILVGYEFEFHVKGPATKDEREDWADLDFDPWELDGFDQFYNNEIEYQLGLIKSEVYENIDYSLVNIEELAQKLLAVFPVGFGDNIRYIAQFLSERDEDSYYDESPLLRGDIVQGFKEELRVFEKLDPSDLISNFDKINRIVDEYLDNVDDFLAEVCPAIVEYNEVIGKHHDILMDILEFLESLQTFLKHTELDSPENMEEFHRLFQNFVDGDDAVYSIGDVLGLYETLFSLVGNGVVVEMDEVIAYMEVDSSDVDVEFGDIVGRFLARQGGSSGDVVRIVRSGVYEYLKTDEVKAIEKEGQAPNMVEVVTNPLTLYDALSVVNRMSTYIEEVGSTSDITGLHINISIRGVDMNNDTIDPLRLLLLVSGKHITDEFVPRVYVNDMLKYFEGRSDNAARAYVEDGPNGLEKLSRGYIPNFVKYQGINFGHIGATHRSDARVEFRFPGGKDYHKDPQKIHQHTIRLGYMMMMLFDDRYQHDDFYKDLVRLWNEVSMRDHGVSFAEMISDARGR